MTLSGAQLKAFVAEFERRYAERTPPRTIADAHPSYRVPWSEMEAWWRETYGTRLHPTDRVELYPLTGRIIRKYAKAGPGDPSYRGDVCELCGQNAKPIPRTGKRRRPHKCSHGQQCVRGQRLNGTHANHALCAECREHGRYA